MSMAVGVFGVGGVGKSTLLDAHVKAHPVDQHVGGSSIIKAIIAPHSVRELDIWPQEQQDAVRDESIRRLRGMLLETPRHLLVAGHFSLRNRASGAVEPILTAEDHAFFDALVHLDGSAEAVLSQASRDARRRHGQALEAIEEHLVFERALALETAKRMGVPMLVLRAPDLPGRTRELAAFLDQLSR